MNNQNGKIKYVLIGCGRIAPNHIAAAIANSKSLEIAAVCDIIPQRMEELLKKFNLQGAGIRTYTDYRELFEREKPQLAAIATESGKHAEIAIHAVNSECSGVIVEKPIAMSLEDADRLIAAAKEKQVKLCACHQNRFNKSIQKIRSALEEGRFGKIYHAAAHIRWNRGEEYYRQASWRGKWASDGGALMNQCIHNIDLLRWMLGDPIGVMAYTDRLAHPYIEAEDLGIAVVKFKSGAYGLIEGTTNVFPKNLEETLYIFGENGTVKAGGKSVNRIEEWCFADNMSERDAVIKSFCEDPPNVYGFGHTPLYADVIDAIKNDRDPYVSGEAGREALELVLAVYKSAAEGTQVKLPLKQCSTMDFTGRFDANTER